jgi:branched-chain amino acid transport system substrate-binding protein
MRRRSQVRAPAAVMAGLIGFAGLGNLAATTTEAAAAPASGAPIPVQFVNLDATSSTTGARAGVEAAVVYVNRTGGVMGRPLRVAECRTDQTSETGKACIDAAVAEMPAAVFGVQPGTAVDHVAALTAAGIPYVGQTCNTSATLGGQFTTFCFGSDFVGLYASAAGYLRSLGTVQRAALPFVDVPAASTGIKAYADPVLRRAGITPIEVPIPEGTTEVSAALAPVLQTDPGAVIALLTGPGCASSMGLRASQPATAPFVFPALCSDPDVLSDGGAGAKGARFVRQTIALDRRDADVVTYTRAMRRYAPEVDADDVFVQAGFAGIMNLTAALRQVPAGTPVDAAATTAALRAAKQVPMFLTPAATYSCDGTAYPGLRGLCAITSHVVEYRGKGRWTDLGPF